MFELLVIRDGYSEAFFYDTFAEACEDGNYLVGDDVIRCDICEWPSRRVLLEIYPEV